MWKNERTALILKRGKEVIPAMLFGIPSLRLFSFCFSSADKSEFRIFVAFQTIVAMNISCFVNDYREAFGECVPLPVLFFYSDTPLANTEKTGGCFLRCCNVCVRALR